MAETKLEWDGRKIMGAWKDLTELLLGYPDGPLGYRAALIRGAFDKVAERVAKDSDSIAQKYQKMIPGEGGKSFPAPRESLGQAIALEFWCTDPVKYEQEMKGVLETKVSLTFPVRLPYELIAAHKTPIRDAAQNIIGWQGVRGGFWVNLADLIDPPNEPEVHPVVPPPAPMAPTAPTAPPTNSPPQP